MNKYLRLKYDWTDHIQEPLKMFDDKNIYTMEN